VKEDKMKRSLALIVVVMLGQGVFAQRRAEHWVGTWAAAEVGRPQVPPPPLPSPPGQSPPAAPAPFVQFNDQTLRQIVRTSIGGSRLRIVLSNVFGTAPLSVGAAHVAVRDKGASIVASSDRALAFSGNTTTVIPPGGMMISDAVDLAVPALADLAVDLYLPGQTDTPSPVTMHGAALETNYVSSTGNHAGEPAMAAAATTQSWFVLSRVVVIRSQTARVPPRTRTIGIPISWPGA
jgi:hypothetical protein